MTTRAVFEAQDVEKALAPNLRPGQVMVMDNLSAHKGGRVKELIEQRGCQLVYLPPYSPDFNPSSKPSLKGQRTAARSRSYPGLDVPLYGLLESFLSQASRSSVYPQNTRRYQ